MRLARGFCAAEKGNAIGSDGYAFGLVVVSGGWACECLRRRVVDGRRKLGQGNGTSLAKAGDDWVGGVVWMGDMNGDIGLRLCVSWTTAA